MAYLLTCAKYFRRDERGVSPKLSSHQSPVSNGLGGSSALRQVNDSLNE
jgi:hypothetical protein